MLKAVPNFKEFEFVKDQDFPESSKIIDKSNRNKFINLIRERLPFICEFKLIFQATRDGFKAIDFHRLCDKISNTLVVF